MKTDCNYCFTSCHSSTAGHQGSSNQKACYISNPGGQQWNYTKIYIIHVGPYMYSPSMQNICLHNTLCKLKTNSHTYDLRRQYTEQNFSNFITKLESIDWNLVETSSNCNLAYTMFHNTFLKLSPLLSSKKKLGLHTEIIKPCLSEGLKKYIKVKNKLYVHSIRKPSSTNCIAYKTYKHKLMKHYQYNSN